LVIVESSDIGGVRRVKERDSSEVKVGGDGIMADIISSGATIVRERSLVEKDFQAA
jgi:hypothetical protein